MDLLAKHRKHHKPYFSNFRGIRLRIYPDVFNPSYTCVSDFLAEEISIHEGDSVADMFTGCGALGLLAAQKASFVVGTDLNKDAIKCARENAARLGFANKAKFRCGHLWSAIKKSEKFDIIIANPPLLPVCPENNLEMAVADSPEMAVTKEFLAGCRFHMKKNAKVSMTFSSACSTCVGDPIKFISNISKNEGLKMKIIATKDAGYEIYRVLEFKLKDLK